MFTIAASLSICAGLLGCDQGPKASAPAPVAAAPSCNCQQQAQAAPPAPVAQAPRPHRHHHRHQHGMTYETSWQGSPSSVPSSESQASDSASEAHESMDEQGSGAYPPPPPPSAGSDVWVDGYGRGHTASGPVETDGNPAVLSAEDAHRRSDPWRGYNSRCRNAVD
jgi:hypothetical protein